MDVVVVDVVGCFELFVVVVEWLVFQVVGDQFYVVVYLFGYQCGVELVSGVFVYFGMDLEVFGGGYWYVIDFCC